MRTAVADVLRRHVGPHSRLTLGFSGGIDSRVLLHVLADLADEFPFDLTCVHVNHGISPNADAWARFARRTAKAHGVSCGVRKVDISPLRHLGIEAAAREARYAAFATVKADFILSAQHADDQAETLLLQLARGAGVDGLAGMPEKREFRPGKYVLRPFLHIGRAQIENYAAAHGLEWVEDESNDDRALGRNFIRHEIMPRLQRVNGAAALNLARTAGHLGEAAQLLGELAHIDLELYTRDNVLDLGALGELSAARTRNLLRGWLRRAGCAVPGSAELAEMMRQLAGAKADSGLELRLGDFLLRRFKDEAWLMRADKTPDLGFVAAWNGEPEWSLPELRGQMRFKAARGEGIAAHFFDDPAVVHVRLRQGGERFRPGVGRPRRSLKKLLQEQGIAPWDRERLPLLYHGENLIFVPGMGVAAEAGAAPGERGITVRWVPLRAP